MTQFFQRNEAAMAHEKDVVEKQAAEWGVGADMLYLRPGSTMVRILPPYSQAGVWFRQIVRHRVRTSGQVVICACPTLHDLPCMICEKAQELKESNDPIKMKFAKDNLKPAIRYLYNVLCYSAPADNRGQQAEFGKVYVLEGGIMVHKQLVSLDTDTMTGWVDITNFQRGVNVIIKRTGSNLDTKYDVQPSGHGRTDVCAELQARGFDPAKLVPVDLDALFTPPDREKQAEIVSRLQIGSSLPVGAGGFIPPLQPTVPFQPPVVPGIPVVPPVSDGSNGLTLIPRVPVVPSGIPGVPVPNTEGPVSVEAPPIPRPPQVS